MVEAVIRACVDMYNRLMNKLLIRPLNPCYAPADDKAGVGKSE